MNLTDLSKTFFREIDRRIGPFDRPLLFRPFPFQAGGGLNLLTVGKGGGHLVRYVSWDLFGHPDLKRGALGRYELLADCDDERWCADILTNIGRMALREPFEPGETLDIKPWVDSTARNEGVVFEEALRLRLEPDFPEEACGLLRCVGVTREELEFAEKHGVPALMETFRRPGIYPNTITRRESVDLPI